MEGKIKNGVSNEKTADGWLVTVTEDGTITNRRIFSDKAKALEYEQEEKRRLGF